MSKKILITGCNGFIGSHVFRWLNSLNKYTVLGPHRNWLNISDDLCVKEFMEAHQPDVIVHLAANPNTKPGDFHLDIINDNIVGTHNLLHYCPKGTKFIFASSVVVYGNYWKCCNPETEEIWSASEDSLLEPISVYATTKIAGEGLVCSYVEQEKIQGVNLRLCATVGPNLTHGVVKAFIDKLSSDNEYLEVFGEEPGPYKPYIHVDDVCETIENLIEKDWIFSDTFNVCPSDNINILGVAEAVMSAMNISRPIKWLGKEYTWAGDNPFILCDNTNLTWLLESQIQSSYDAIYKGVKDALTSR